MLISPLILVGQNTENQLTEYQRMRAQIFQLRSQLLQCQVSITNKELSQEQQSLLNEFRDTMKPKDNQVFDWNTLTFKDRIPDQSEDKK